MADELGRTLKLVVAYDGRRYAGSQRQAGRQTIQGELELAARAVFKDQSLIRLAGRTDSGVHAVGQVASITIESNQLSTEAVRRALNAHLPPDISVATAEEAEPGFDPRRDATWRSYRYRIWLGPRLALLEGQALQIEGALDLGAMSESVKAFVGEHDFGSFSGLGSGVPGSGWEHRPRRRLRRVLECEVVAAAGAEWLPAWGQAIELRVTGDAFLPRQVRGMVGAALEVGRGRRSADWMGQLLEQPDRRHGPTSAPPHGLVLWEVGYHPWVPPRRDQR